MLLRKCARILQMLDSAGEPGDLNLAGLFFHGLHGNPQRWSIRVTANYRITFGWDEDAAKDVDLEDYH